MKSTNILYWTITAIFALLVIFSSISNVTSSPEAIVIFKHLGYPAYLLPFLGVAKIAGAIVLLIPGIPRLKEWAYAGLFFDFTGAAYSFIRIGDPPVYLIIFAIFYLLLFLSYFFYHKRRRLQNIFRPKNDFLSST